MTTDGQASSENAKYYRTLFPDRRASSAEIEPANLKLSALSYRNGRILTVKCQTTSISMRDQMVLQAYVIVVALWMVSVDLLARLMMLRLEPRLP